MKNEPAQCLALPAGFGDHGLNSAGKSTLILVLTVFAPLFFLVELISGKVRIFIIWLSDALTRITDSDLEENLNMKLA